MARRVLLTLLVVAFGVLGAAWFSSATFTVTRTVAVEPPSVLFAPMPRLPAQAEMRIKCSRTSSNYVTEGGETRMFNEATGSPETSGPLCEKARAQRRVASVAFVLAGLLGGGVVLVMGRVRDRWAAERAATPPPVSATPHADSSA